MFDQLLPFAGPSGAIGLLAACYWMVVTDRLVPGRSHRRQLADKDRQLEDKDAQIAKWQAAWEREVERADLTAKQVDKLVAQGETTLAVLSALPRVKDPA